MPADPSSKTSALDFDFDLCLPRERKSIGRDFWCACGVPDYVAALDCWERGGCRATKREGERRKEQVMTVTVDDEGVAYSGWPWPGTGLIDNRRAPGGSDRRQACQK